MKKLKKVGFFNDLVHGYSTEPALSESKGKFFTVDLEKTIRYLDSGALLISSPGIVFDQLCDEERIIGSLDILTDGTWAWPSDLIYYLKHYKVELPKEFLEHMLKNDWKLNDFNIGELEL